MPKTPDETKKGLECCITDNCKECPYYPLYEVFGCKLARAKDAIAIIQQLQAENAEQAERIRELEALLMDEVSKTELIHVVDLNDDAVKVIQQLEAQNAEKDKRICQLEDHFREATKKVEQLEVERDALLKYLTESHFVPCDICKHDVNGSVMGCKRVREIKGPCFEWRGVQKEENS